MRKWGTRWNRERVGRPWRLLISWNNDSIALLDESKDTYPENLWAVIKRRTRHPVYFFHQPQPLLDTVLDTSKVSSLFDTPQGHA